MHPHSPTTLLGTNKFEIRIAGWERYTPGTDVEKTLVPIVAALNNTAPCKLMDEDRHYPRFRNMKYDTLKDRKAILDFVQVNPIPPIRIKNSQCTLTFRANMDRETRSRTRELRGSCFAAHKQLEPQIPTTKGVVVADYASNTLCIYDHPVAFFTDEHGEHLEKASDPRIWCVDNVALQIVATRNNVNLDGPGLLLHLQTN